MWRLHHPGVFKPPQSANPSMARITPNTCDGVNSIATSDYSEASLEGTVGNLGTRLEWRTLITNSPLILLTLETDKRKHWTNLRVDDL